MYGSSRLRIIFKNCKYFININRQFKMSAIKCKEELENLKTNPYFSKYAQKIATLQSTSPEEFLDRISKQQVDPKKAPDTQGDRQYASLLKPKSDLTTTCEEEKESLDKIMKTDLIGDKSYEEIEEIWQKYHVQKDVISAVIPKKDYELIRAQSAKFPTFIFPLPRSNGFEFIMAQFRGNSVHFTPLICYQVHKENAPECLKITHYTDLEETKGLVLMRGEFDKNVINGKEAQCLANQLQIYYSGRDANKMKLLETFTLKPDEFRHMDLIKEIENISLTS